MSQTGGKRKANKSLKAWVAFIKKVQREEKLSYKDAMMRAKQRKDKGEKWMKGGSECAVAPPQMVGGRKTARRTRRSARRARTARRSRK
jgi:hypothetical protein